MSKQSECASFMLTTALLLSTAMCGQLAFAQSLERLPPTYPIAQLERLPKPDDGPSVNGPQLEGRRAIQFAGGSIELKVPADWWSEEVPFGREVRLVIAPQRPLNIRRMPIDGMWIAYHAVGSSDASSEDALSRELSNRLRSAVVGNAQYSPPVLFQFGDWPAAVAEFTSTEASSANASITGRHVLVRTEWGVFEFHASAPDAVVESRSNIWTATWESLRLNPPATTMGSSREPLGESNGIIGNWKSYRSRMQFSSDGRIVIVPDAVGNNRSTNPLTGTYEARNDLVFVRWDDGSRLNFRWRLQGNDLFLTDHEGQISHLKRALN
ncbi:MAG: hypothetical protein O3C40_21605 [Planctomycetota bacterium]|nr:hypothetical protein [Planctomycetota bacterium]